MLGKSIAEASPAQWVGVSLVCMGIVTLLCFYTLTQQPWLGVRLQADDGEGLRVVQVQDDSPAFGILQAGDRIVALGAPGRSPVMLYADLLDEPNNLSSYARFNRWREDQAQLWRSLRSSEVQLSLANGQRVLIHLAPTRPLSAIPYILWAYALLPPLPWLLGLIVFLKQRHRLEAQLFLTNGVLYYGVMMVSTLYNRELALDAQLLSWLAFLENVGTNAFSSAMMFTVLTFPRKLLPKESLLILAGVIALVPINSTWQLIELPIHAYLVQFLLFNSVIFSAGSWQWYQSRQNPEHRAMLKWILLSLFVSLALAFPLFFLPTVFSEAPLVPIEGARLFVGIYFIGMGLAIVRYRLFDVQRWWFRFFLWLLGGATVVAVDLLLIFGAHLSAWSAMSVSLVAAGFLYFPLRQWAIQRILEDRRQHFEARLCSFTNRLSLAHTDQAFERIWRLWLIEQFAPAQLSENPDMAAAPAELTAHGLGLVADALNERNSWLLQGKRQGRALFTPEDVQLITAVWQVASSSRAALRAREQAASVERQRIMQDLHDSMGAKLLTLVHRAPSSEWQASAREALTTLRETVRLSSSQQPVRLVDLLAEWRSECRERLESADVDLQWREDVAPSAPQDLPVDTALALSQVLRESLNNALKHAHPSAIDIDVAVDAEGLCLRVSHDGAATLPEDWQPGFGLSSMRQRVQRLGGELHFSHDAQIPHRVSLRCCIPLSRRPSPDPRKLDALSA